MASPEEINEKEYSIIQYIPHRSPMVMVGEILSAEGKICKTSFRIKPENIFLQGGFLSEAGIIENIAQTAATGAGYRARLNSMEPPPGFIGQIRNLIIHFLPEAGREIITEVTVGHEVMDATVITGRSSVDGKPLAECEMKIFTLKTG
jgi:predicted hotdog family 3-hydroxylacyl-ACP dehydratase